MKSVVILLTCVLLPQEISFSQVVTQGAAIPDPERMVVLLRSKSAADRQMAAAVLNLRQPGDVGESCDEYEKVELLRPTLKRRAESALVIVTAVDCESIFFAPLIATQSGWVATGTVPISTKYSAPSYHLDSLVTPEESEIIISNHTVDSGTGIAQRNLTVLKIVAEATRVVFDQPELLRMFIPATIAGRQTNTREEKSSVFTFEKSEPGVPGLKTILEKRVLRVRDRSIVVYRSYVWQPELAIFRMVGEAPPG